MLDEFSDCISAYVSEPGDAQIAVASVCELGTDGA